MTYKAIISILLASTLLLGFVLLPNLSKLKSNADIDFMIRHPDVAFEIFSQCKNHVSDVNRCYNAYSAAVNLANSIDCSSEGIGLQFRFKLLIEGNSARIVNDEIARVCPNAPVNIPET